MKTPTLSGGFAAKFFAAWVVIMLISGAQTLHAQKLGRGFKLLEDKEYTKAMAFFTDAKDKKIELFAVNYALSKIQSDREGDDLHKKRTKVPKGRKTVGRDNQKKLQIRL